MKSISAQNALKLSAWIASQHPDFFRQLVKTTQALQRSPLGRLGYFGLGFLGDDVSLSDVSVDIPDVAASTSAAIDTAAFNVDSTDLTLQNVGSETASYGDVSSSTADSLNQAIAAPATPDASTADSSAASGSFWSSLGSGVSSAASTIGKVATSLISPQVLSSVANAAGTYFTAQAKTASAQAQAQAQTQQAILQSQLSRVSQGASPASISYTRNPTTGALTPVYHTNSGTVPVTSSLLNQLSNPSASLGGLSPLMLMGGGLFLVLALSLFNRSRSP